MKFAELQDILLQNCSSKGSCIFLAVQNRSIGDLVPWSVGRPPLTIRVYRETLVTFETFD